MKSLILIILIASSTSFAQAGSVIEPSSYKVNMRGERPSCEMLAWRWVKVLSSLQEGRDVLSKFVETNDLANLQAVSKRIPEGLPEGVTEKIQEVVTFNVPGVRESNFVFHALRSASISWQNETENLPPDFSVKVKSGVVEVIVETNYMDYCFHQGLSVVKIEVNGRRLFLNWSTQEKDLAKKLQLLKL